MATRGAMCWGACQLAGRVNIITSPMAVMNSPKRPMKAVTIGMEDMSADRPIMKRPKKRRTKPEIKRRTRLAMRDILTPIASLFFFRILGGIGLIRHGRLQE